MGRRNGWVVTQVIHTTFGCRRGLPFAPAAKSLAPFEEDPYEVRSSTFASLGRGMAHCRRSERHRHCRIIFACRKPGRSLRCAAAGSTGLTAEQVAGRCDDRVNDRQCDGLRHRHLRPPQSDGRDDRWRSASTPYDHGRQRHGHLRRATTAPRRFRTTRSRATAPNPGKGDHLVRWDRAGRRERRHGRGQHHDQQRRRRRLRQRQRSGRPRSPSPGPNSPVPSTTTP